MLVSCIEQSVTVTVIVLVRTLTVADKLALDGAIRDSVAIRAVCVVTVLVAIKYKDAVEIIILVLIDSSVVCASMLLIFIASNADDIVIDLVFVLIIDALADNERDETLVRDTLAINVLVPVFCRVVVVVTVQDLTLKRHAPNAIDLFLVAISATVLGAVFVFVANSAAPDAIARDIVALTVAIAAIVRVFDLNIAQSALMFL